MRPPAEDNLFRRGPAPAGMGPDVLASSTQPPSRPVAQSPSRPVAQSPGRPVARSSVRPRDRSRRSVGFGGSIPTAVSGPLRRADPKRMGVLHAWLLAVHRGARARTAAGCDLAGPDADREVAGSDADREVAGSDA